MPAPRSVLADIADLNLDPSREHTVVNASGRLRPPSTLSHVPAKDSKDKKPLVEPKAKVEKSMSVESVMEKKPEQPKLEPKKLVVEKEEKKSSSKKSRTKATKKLDSTKNKDDDSSSSS